MHRSRPAFFALSAIVLTGTLTGCASFSPSRHSFGVRPDVPVGPAAPEVQEACKEKKLEETRELPACLEFESVVKWSADLEEAYLSRATMNRWSIYLAGTIGLATVAASGGLAAASAVGLGTIALLNISGGFAAGVFAVIDSPTLADIYTVAAGEIATARSNARNLIGEALKARSASPDSGVVSAYYTRAGELRVQVAEARNVLETARTSSAARAVQRAQTQINQLKSDVDQIKKEIKTARATQVVVNPQITAIQDAAGASVSTMTGGSEKELFLIVENIKLEGYRNSDLKVELGGRTLDVTGLGPDWAKPNTWRIRFKAPGTRPQANEPNYSPSLLVDGQTKATAPAAVKLTYN